MPAPVGKSEHIEYLIYRFFIGLLIIQKQRKHNILLHIQLGYQLKRLEHKPDIAPPEDRPLLLLHGE